RIEDSLKEAKLINKKEQITAFGLRRFLEVVLADFKLSEIRYYGTKIRTYDITDKHVLSHAQTMVESQRRLKRSFMKQNIQFIISGSLRVRETVCYKCKKKSLIFREKGVDVRLAVDLAAEASGDTTQVILSSDSDLLPALRHAKKQNSRLIYV